MSDDCTREGEFHMHSDRCYEAGRREGLAGPRVTFLCGVSRDDIEAAILARLEAKSDHTYQWPRWAAAHEASLAVADLLNIPTTTTLDGDR